MSAIIDPPTADAPARLKVGARFLFAYAFANFGLWVALLAPIIVSLQLHIEHIDPAHKERSLSLVLGAGALLGLLANPLCGRLSDRTTSRFGMRRPWILASSIVGVAGLAVVAEASSVPGVLVGWCIVQLGYNGLLAGLMPVLPDQVPPHRRGMVSGTLGVGQALAAIVATGIAGGLSNRPLLMFTVPGFVAVLAAVVLFTQLRDRRLDPADRPPLRLGDLLRSFWVNPRRYPDFAWAWVSRFMIFMAIASVLNYQVYYLQDRLQLSGDDVTRMVGIGVLVQTVSVVLSSNLTGWLSDRFGRRRIFVCLAAAVTAVGLLILAVAADEQQYLLAMVFTGLGQGTYFAVDLALVADVLPNRHEDAAKDLGVINVANTLPQSLAPAIAPLLLAVGAGGNYTALFIAGAVFAVLSGASVLAVKGAR